MFMFMFMLVLMIVLMAMSMLLASGNRPGETPDLDIIRFYGAASYFLARELEVFTIQIEFTELLLDEIQIGATV